MASQQQDLASINSATLGAEMPEVTLPDGSKIQTGTVGALIQNIKAYDALVAKGSSASAQDMATKQEYEARMRASLPVLHKAGIFGLFAPAEWVNGSSPGRKFVGELALNENK